MQYRKFGRLDWRVSALGFGCMRLPTFDQLPLSENIDETQTIRMIQTAVDRGVNYLDTAYPYHNGKSEVVLGRALRDGYRAKVRLATKSPVWMLTKGEDFDRYLAEQMKRLDTDHIDFYLLHALNKERWDAVLRLGILERGEAACRDGRVGHLGFSFHDRHEVFLEIVDGYDGWTLCQVQYNYLDTENQAGTAGVEHAAAKGLAVVAMEPLLGGRLANPPASIRGFFDGVGPWRTPAEWALAWVWDQPAVSVVLSGMNTFGQMEENVRAAEAFDAGAWSAEARGLIERLRRAYRERIPIPCTNCAYCLPCPSGVNIPRNFDFYNGALVHEEPAISRHLYARLLTEAERANACTECGACEDKCPQGISIREWLKKVHSALGEGRA
jgi:predicted aldo/keto reductase-like oxidoreductase